MKINFFLQFLAFFLINLSLLFATPSTQIWNPSTDIQKEKTFHLGIDNYFNDSSSAYYLGLTYGLFKNFEIGVDLNEVNKTPITLNAKYGIPEGNNIAKPAIAVGIMNFGTVKDVNNTNIGYILLAKTFKYIGRISVGGYTGNTALLKNNNGEIENNGYILTIDKYLTKKIWGSIDYASGENMYGSLSGGLSYAFTDNISIIFGAVIYNNGIPTQATTQLDINF